LIAAIPEPRDDGTLAWNLDGHISADEKAAGDYRLVPFEVPPGLQQLTVSYEYGGAVSAALPAGHGNVVDIGCFDSRGSEFLQAVGFRGWSGSDRRTFTIAADGATPGYLPGPIYAGTWHVILGLYHILPDGCDFHLTIVGQKGETPPCQPGPLIWPVLSSEARWYRGDLQSHTHHSDGTGSLEDLAAVARARGLDFVAVTDHNTISHLPYLAEVGGDDLLLIPGEEITTYYGHANAWGIRGWQEFRCRDDATMARIMDAVHAAGAVVSVNHPKDTGVPWEYTSNLPFDCVEAWQGPWPWKNHESLAFWHSLLLQGRRVTAVGGSDRHVKPFSGEPAPDDLGTPTTWVYARELSTRGILEGIRAGHVFISPGPQGPQLYLSAGADGLCETVMGDSIKITAGQAVRLRARVVGGKGLTLRIVSPSGAVSVSVDNDDFRHRWESRPDGDTFYRLELVDRWCDETTPDSATMLRHALSNPIYVAFGPQPTKSLDDRRRESTQ